MSPAQPLISTPQKTIPVLLLKTRSQPDDTYEEHFQAHSTGIEGTANNYTFQPQFIPVLEHTKNESTLSDLEHLLRSRRLKDKYGGMIFTSQRAVEAWADIVHKVEIDPSSPTTSSADNPSKPEPDPFSNISSLTPFPLYVVGPATDRALTTLISTSASLSPPSPFTSLNPTTHGSQTGSGATLAPFILTHYNALHATHHFTYHEAPRLPYIPLIGMSSQNYGRKRLEADDPRLIKKPLLFLVGETRRDVIPRVLGGAEGKEWYSGVERRCEVEEVEVYRTEARVKFREEFGGCVAVLDGEKKCGVNVVVVFSPQGSEVMLREIGWLDAAGRVTEQARRRWRDVDGEVIEVGAGNRWIVATIGPTTKDYLKDELGVEPDVCASKPSPEGLRAAIVEFLKAKKITT